MTEMTATAQSVAFVGRRKPLFWLLVKNGLLTILTIGIYRFWAKTHVRRYYWNNITIAGDPLEYLGRPIELLIGFLIAIAVLLPLSIVTGVIAFVLAAVSPALEFTGSLLFFVALAWLIGFALYRARRYRLTRTSWRGIRGGQTGSAVRYAFLRLGLAVVSVLSLGLTYPWGRVVLHRFTIRNTQFGNASFDFQGTTMQLFRLWIPVQGAIIVFIGAVILSAGAMLDFAQEIAELATDPTLADDSFAAPSFPPGLALLIPVYFLGAILFIWFRVAELRYVFNSMLLSGARTRSDFPFSNVVWRGVLLWLSLLAIAALFGVAFGLAGLAGLASPVLAFLIGVILVLPISLSLFTLQHLVFWMPLLRKFCARLSVDNVYELERIAQSTKQDPRYGEGLADALSVDAFPL